VDWNRQSNDRLGRTRRHRQREHRRQILRARRSNANTHSDGYTHSDGHAYGYSHAYTNPNSYSHSYSNAYSYSNTNTYTDTDPMHRKMRTDTEAAPDTGTAPVEVAISDCVTDRIVTRPGWIGLPSRRWVSDRRQS